MKRAIVAICCAFMLEMSMVPVRPACAEELGIPNVTSEISSADYWLKSKGTSSRVLADDALIAEVNESVRSEAGTGVRDLEAWEKTTFDGIAYAQELKDAALADAELFYSCGAIYDASGNAYEEWDAAYEAIYQEMVENCANEQASTEELVQFGVCTTRTCVTSLPGTQALWDDAVDPTHDYLYVDTLGVNEPLVVRGISNDGKFYHVATSSTWGWVSVSDVAICADKAEWLEAWDFSAENSIVLCADAHTKKGDAPQTKNLLVPMGTRLELAVDSGDQDDYTVWVPLRNDDGSYARETARLPRTCEASLGYLPLTTANIVKLALKGLEGASGTSDVHLSADCSELIRGTYACFGLELPSSSPQHVNQAVTQYGLEDMADDEKEAFIRTLPAGTVLTMGGHELLYVGSADGSLYVVGARGSIAVDGSMLSEHGCVVSSLDAQRANGDTWLSSIDSAVLPFYPNGYVPPIIAYACTGGDAGAWHEGDGSLAFAFDYMSGGEESTPDHLVGLAVDGQAVDASCYVLGSQGVSVELLPAYLGTLSYGSHTLVASFDDGDDASASFAVEQVAEDVEEKVEAAQARNEEPFLRVSSEEDDDDDWDDEDDDWDEDDEDDDWDDEDEDDEDDDWDDEDDDWDDEDEDDDDWDDEEDDEDDGEDSDMPSSAVNPSGMAYTKLTRDTASAQSTATTTGTASAQSTVSTTGTTAEPLVRTADATDFSAIAGMVLASGAAFVASRRLRDRS